MEVNDLTLSLLALAGIRFVAFFVFAELFLQKRESRYAVISLGWLLYSAGPIFAVRDLSVSGVIEYQAFGYFISVGSLLLMGGLVLYYRTITLTQLFVFFPSIFIGMGAISILFPVTIPLMAVAIQSIIILITLIIVLFKRKWFILVGGKNGFFWLLPFLVLSLFHAFGFNFYLSWVPLSIRFFLTFLINIVLFVFFLHFDKYQSFKQLQASEERYRQLFQNAGDAIYVAQERKIVFFNDMVGKLSGYSDSELMNLPFSKFVHEEDKEMALNRYLGLIQGKNHPEKYSFRIIHKNLEVRWVELKVVVIEWEGKTATLNFMNDITERIHSEELLKASLKEKVTLIDEIHHRVKNNMQVMASLIKLQINREDDLKIKDILRENQGRVYAMSAIHESLYQSEHLSEINFKSYLSRLVRMLLQTYAANQEKISYNIDSPDIRLNIDTANPLSLVLNELITNVLKYAFPDDQNGTINIRMLMLKGNSAELVLSDNGVGMPENFDWDSSDTLGLQLVRNLVELQLGGSIDLSSQNGTQFTIKFNI
jgi:PAS domain S-box-containing protein